MIFDRVCMAVPLEINPALTSSFLSSKAFLSASLIRGEGGGVLRDLLHILGQIESEANFSAAFHCG